MGSRSGSKYGRDEELRIEGYWDSGWAGNKECRGGGGGEGDKFAAGGIGLTYRDGVRAARKVGKPESRRGNMPPKLR